MSTPDITPVTVGAAIIVAITNAEILFGKSLSAPKEKALEALVNGVAVLGFLAHDAFVRRGRAKVEAAKAANPQPVTVQVAPSTTQGA